MATRGIIAIKTGDTTWRGRYVHWDNYPSRMVPLLAHLVNRDGFDKVVHTILTQHTSWSTLDPFAKTGTESGFDGQNFEPGYGWYHTDAGADYEYTESSGDYSWAEYAYIMDKEGLTVCEINGNPEEEMTTKLDRHSWTDALLVTS